MAVINPDSSPIGSSTYQILAIGDARAQDGLLFAGYAKTRYGCTDFDRPMWAKPTLFNRLWLRWCGRHSLFRKKR